MVAVRFGLMKPDKGRARGVKQEKAQPGIGHSDPVQLLELDH